MSSSALKQLKPGFHIIISDIRIVCRRIFGPSDLDYHMENTLAIVSNDPYIRSDLIVPIELCSNLCIPIDP